MEQSTLLFEYYFPLTTYLCFDSILFLIVDIEENPLNSILISSGYNRNGERFEIWNDKSERRELEWERSRATMARLQVEVENMRNTLDIQEKKMNEETKLYHVYRRALDSNQN